MEQGVGAHLIEVDGVVVHLVRKQVKGLRISIDPFHGRVRVSAPLRMNEALVRFAIAGKVPWIRRKQAMLTTQSPVSAGGPVASEAWCREKLRAQIPLLRAKWEPRIGVMASEVRIRRMKTRWGSCNIRTRRIWLNLELAKKSPACLEYVFVHELVHLIERGHGERFRKLMDRFMPTWRTHRSELNRLPPSFEWSGLPGLEWTP